MLAKTSSGGKKCPLHPHGSFAVYGKVALYSSDLDNKCEGADCQLFSVQPTCGFCHLVEGCLVKGLQERLSPLYCTVTLGIALYGQLRIAGSCCVKEFNTIMGKKPWLWQRWEASLWSMKQNRLFKWMVNGSKSTSWEDTLGPPKLYPFRAFLAADPWIDRGFVGWFISFGAISAYCELQPA